MEAITASCLKNRTILDGQVAAHNESTSAIGGKPGLLGFHSNIIGKYQVTINTNRRTGTKIIETAAFCNQFAGTGDGNGAGSIVCIDGVIALVVAVAANYSGTQQLDVQIALFQPDKGVDLPFIIGIEIRSIDAINGDRRGLRLPLDIVVTRGSTGLCNDGFTTCIFLVKPVAYLAR